MTDWQNTQLASVILWKLLRSKYVKNVARIGVNS